MRALVLVLALTLACAVGAMAQTTSTSTTTTTTVTQPNTLGTCPAVGDEMADACMANSLGLTKQQVTQLRSQGLSYSDIATAQAIAMKSGRPLSEVVTAYQTDKSWPAVAARYNLSMSDIAMTPMMSSAEVEAFHRNFISQYYGIPQSQVTQLRNQGFSWDEINMIANAAARTGQPVSTIASLRSQGMSWADIAARYNVALSDLTCPSPRVVATRTVVGAGPTVPTVMYDSHGNPVLTWDQAQRFYKMGYDWLDVAVAANFQEATAIPVQYWLMRIRQGSLWPNLAYEWGVPFAAAFDVSAYPFPRTSVFPSSTEEMRIAQIQSYQQKKQEVSPSTLGPPMMMPNPPSYP